MKLTNAYKQQLASQTLFLDAHHNKVTFKQRKWHIDNNIYIPVTCTTCNNLVRWDTKTNIYRRFCSSKCAHSNIDVVTKTMNTCIERFGVSTNLKTEATKEKIKLTNLSRYGVDNFAKSSEFVKKSKQSFLNKYGVDNPSKVPAIMRKIDATNMRRYGRRRSSQLLISQLSYDIKNDRELMEQLYFKDKLSVAEIAAKLNVGHSQLCIHLKDKLGFDLRYSTRQSIAEKEIGSYIESLGFKVEYSVKTILGRKEIDIYVPDKNFAIEYNGLIWHSEISGNKHKSYHLDKTNLCMQAGITLLHIMDFEYKNNPSLVKSRIRAKLGVNNRIFARKTTVVIVDKRVAMKFFSDNHIQGSIGGNIYIGLEYNGRIVAVMSFCKSRYNKKYTWELLRYCSIQDVNVIGGASKLFKHFTRDHTGTIVSYCDLRWNTGNVYAAMGFKKVSDGAPNFWYTQDYSTVYSRIRYQKHKLKDLLCMYDSNLTAWENMQLNGFDRYWDCGSSVWVFNSN